MAESNKRGTARRVTLVTGAARRVGAALARSFARPGDAIVLHHGNSAAAADALAAELRDSGADVYVVQADLADASAPERIVAETIATFGALDTVVSSASMMESRPFNEVTVEEWDRTMAINLRAPFFLMQAAARVMVDGGVIVQISDHLASEAIWPMLIPHQVSKAALTQVVSALAATLAPKIRVNAVAPGLVLAPDDMNDAVMSRFLKDVPLARIGSPSDVVQAVHYLIDAQYVTGTVLTVDGGRHLWR